MDTTFPFPSFTKRNPGEIITRLPISPPPEEEIRSKDYAKHPSPFTTFTELCTDENNSFTDQFSFGKDLNDTALVSRKRARPTPCAAPLADSSNAILNNSSVVPSPNPKPRKQVKTSGAKPNTEPSSRHKPPVQSTEHDTFNSTLSRTDTALENCMPHDFAEESRPSPSLYKRRTSSSRLSITPVVPYEPPTEQFTPPRSVVMAVVSPAVAKPRSSKSLSTTSTRNYSVEPIVIKFKAERLTSPFPLPPLDLSRPVPPPSPTNDPLLLMDDEDISPLSSSPLCKQNENEQKVHDEETAGASKESMVSISDSNIFMDTLLDDLPVPTYQFDGSDDTDASNTFVREEIPSLFSLSGLQGYEPTDHDVFSSDDEGDEGNTGEAEGEFTGRFKFYQTPVKDDPPSSATRVRRESWGRPISPFPCKLSGSYSSDEEYDQGGNPLHNGSAPPSPTPIHGHGRRRRHDNISDSSRSSGFVEVEAAGSLLVASEPMKQLQAHEGRPESSLTLRSVDDDSSHDEDDMSGIIEISSSDPRAAARAAALLKLHHCYDVNLRINQSAPAKHQDSMVESDDHVGFTHTEANNREPRSPKDWSRNMEANTSTAFDGGQSQGHHDFEEAGIPARCASVPVSETSYSQLSQETSTAWTKSHWKKLDSCFTDERYAVAAAMGLPGEMADVSDVELDAVAARFADAMNEDGEWDQFTIIRRATALVARQRIGKGAPPSSSMLQKCERLRLASAERNSISNSNLLGRSNVPASLLAPRYAHLLEEATSSKIPSVPNSNTSSDSGRKNSQLLPSSREAETSISMHSYHLENGDSRNESPQMSIFSPKRALDYLGSFLRRDMNKSDKETKPSSHVPALPLPDRSRIPHAPVTTPVKRPIARAQHPKDFVHLTHTEPMVKERIIAKNCAKEFVTLRHVEPPKSVPRARVISGSIATPLQGKRGVKDLVKGFEEVGQRTASNSGLRKVASTGNLRNQNVRPVWRP